MDPKLRTYVLESLKRGFTKENIKNKLRNAGYAEGIINKIFNELGVKDKKPMGKKHTKNLGVILFMVLLVGIIAISFSVYNSDVKEKQHMIETVELNLKIINIIDESVNVDKLRDGMIEMNSNPELLKTQLDCKAYVERIASPTETKKICDGATYGSSFAKPHFDSEGNLISTEYFIGIFEFSKPEYTEQVYKSFNHAVTLSNRSSSQRWIDLGDREVTIWTFQTNRSLVHLLDGNRLVEFTGTSSDVNDFLPYIIALLKD